MRRNRNLPPLHALRAFEAAGRLLSFREAAAELLITQSAVSHHIRQLEEDLGLRLFNRHARSVSLTEEGAEYLAQVVAAFAQLKGATADLRARAAPQRLTVSLPPSFLSLWLMPRLTGLEAAHADIDLVLDPTLALARYADGEADLGIRFGLGPWPDVDGELLMHVGVTPVLSPDLLAAGPPVETPRDLLRHRLLLPLRATEWQIWSRAMGLDVSAASTRTLSDYGIIQQAAVDGHGVAIGRDVFVRGLIAEGRLVAPFPPVPMPPETGYHLVWQRDRAHSAAMARFIAWIKAEVAASQPDQPQQAG